MKNAILEYIEQVELDAEESNGTASRQAPDLPNMFDWLLKSVAIASFIYWVPILLKVIEPADRTCLLASALILSTGLIFPWRSLEWFAKQLAFPGTDLANASKLTGWFAAAFLPWTLVAHAWFGSLLLVAVPVVCLALWRRLPWAIVPWRAAPILIVVPAIWYGIPMVMRSLGGAISLAPLRWIQALITTAIAISLMRSCIKSAIRFNWELREWRQRLALAANASAPTQETE